MASPSCLRVLVADDSALVRRLVVERLASVPSVCIVGEATCGDDALDQVRDGRTDVLILDLNMAPGDGLHVLRRLGSSDGPRPRVLVLTNHAVPEYHHACTQLGAAGFYDKASELDRVAAVLQGWATALDAPEAATEIRA